MEQLFSHYSMIIFFLIYVLFYLFLLVAILKQKLVEKKEIDQLREELARTKQELYNTKMDRDILKKSLVDI